MRDLFARLFMGLTAALFFVSMAMAQAGAAGENNMYNRLKNDGTGGPAPKHSVTGVWTGALEATRPEVPPMTPLGQKLFSQSKTEANTGTWADVNDPWKTCDPFGMPRSAVNEIRGLSFAEMPDKIIVLHQYNRIWRDVWMDGRQLPAKVDAKGAPDSRFYGYSVGHWEDDYNFVVDTNGLDDRTWLDEAGHPHSTEARVQERYTRVDQYNIHLAATIDDPKIYTKPWRVIDANYYWIKDQDFDETFCLPSDAIEYMNKVIHPSGNEGSGK